MAIKTSIHLTLPWVVLLMAFPVAAQMLCDMTGHQEETPLCTGDGAEAEAPGHDDSKAESCRDPGGLNCGMSCCTGLSYIMTPPGRAGKINGIHGPIHSLVQNDFWVGLDPFYHPPRA